MKLIIHTKERSYLIMEMPTYRMPKWSNVGYTIVEKTKAFVLEAGKVILAISIILWVLASYGPPQEMNRAAEVVSMETMNMRLTPQAFDDRIAAYKLEHSYAGIIGKTIEPVIRPLGYDWKIGIALITSFAAREVFVGTIATIYSLGSTEDQPTIKSRLKSEINPETGGPRFTPAVGFSLLVFLHFRDAVCQHTGNCKTRDQRMEMAIVAIGLYDRSGLPFCVYRLSGFVINCQP